MRSQASTDEIARYSEQGFLVMAGFLDPDEVLVWRQCVEDAVSARERDSTLVPLIKQERWPPEYGFRQHMNLWQTDQRMRELLLGPRIGRVASQLMGTDAVRIWYDQSFIKRPWAAPTPLHQDNPYWAFHAENAITLWVALDDVDTHNGALVYIPGSHHTKRWQQTAGDGLGDILLEFPEWAGIEPVYCPVKAGSVIWHNGLCAHGSGANMSSQERRALNLALMPGGARFNGIQNILPDDLLGQYEVGQALVDERLNPLIWPAD